MKRNDVIYLAGCEDVMVRPIAPFSPLVCEFLDVLSKEILNDKQLKSHSDIVSFAFWIRKGNIQKQKELCNFGENVINKYCIGRGLAFHIAPSNVPINFAYSFVFGLLAGNSNIVRVSSKNYSKVSLLCDKINDVMNIEQFTFIRETNSIIMYDRNSENTDVFSKECDVRIIWGGDDTIKEIRKSPIKAKSKEIVFADRYSFGIISPEYILNMDKKEQKIFAQQFYNDTYLMDQNACSTPHFIFWKSVDKEIVVKAQKIFWDNVYEESKKYDLEDSKVSDKYTDLCLNLASDVNGVIKKYDIVKVTRYENQLYVLRLKNVPDSIERLRGRFGMFFECQISELEEIKECISEKVQTVAVAGIDKNLVHEFVINNSLRGIDRVVSFGDTLNIGLIWDGYNLITEMCRIIY